MSHVQPCPLGNPLIINSKHLKHSYVTEGSHENFNSVRELSVHFSQVVSSGHPPPPRATCPVPRSTYCCANNGCQTLSKWNSATMRQNSQRYPVSLRLGDKKVTISTLQYPDTNHGFLYTVHQFFTKVKGICTHLTC